MKIVDSSILAASIQHTVDSTGFYERLQLSEKQGDRPDNVRVFIATHRRKPMADEVVEDHKFMIDRYYKLGPNKVVCFENIIETDQFKLDERCGLNTPTYGELFWQWYKEATTIWTVNLPLTYYYQYKYRSQCHELDGCPTSTPNMARAASRFNIMTMLKNGDRPE